MSGLSLSVPEAVRPELPGRPLRLLPDDRLARLAARGNQAAVATLYERHHQGLYRYCRSLLGRDEDAHDALQNTMVKAMSSLPGDEREMRIKPWLYRVAHNESITILRGRRPTRELDAAAEVAAPSGADPAIREELRTLIADLGALPERQRGALVMRELSGLSYADIAAALDTSLAGAKQIVYEARVALHDLAEGREMDCEAVRTRISAADR